MKWSKTTGTNTGTKTLPILPRVSDVSANRAFTCCFAFPAFHGFRTVPTRAKLAVMRSGVRTPLSPPEKPQVRRRKRLACLLFAGSSTGKTLARSKKPRPETGRSCVLWWAGDAPEGEPLSGGDGVFVWQMHAERETRRAADARVSRYFTFFSSAATRLLSASTPSRISRRIWYASPFSSFLFL